MPWTEADASAHTKLANTPRLRALWVEVATRYKRETGDDVTAIRKANYAVSRASPANHLMHVRIQEISRRKRRERKAGWLRFV